MTEQDLKKFGFRLQQRRKELGIERVDIADHIQVHLRTYAKWENGQISPPLDNASIPLS